MFLIVLDGCCSYQVEQYLVNGQQNGLSPEDYIDIFILDIFDTKKKLVYLRVSDFCIFKKMYL